MKYYKLTKPGESILYLEREEGANPLQGYQGWTVAEELDRLPEQDEVRQGNKWVKDKTKKEKRDKEAKVNNMTKQELVERLEAIEARLAALEENK